jgi:sugar phosphate isomerase/epimerase
LANVAPWDGIDRAASVSPSTAPAPDRSLRLGLSTGSLYPDVATEDAPAAAAANGFVDLEIMLQTAGEYGAGFTRRLAARCRAAGCRVHAVHVWQQLHPLLSPYHRRAAEGLALFDRAIAAAAALDAGVLVWHGPTRAEVTAPDDWDRFLATVAERAAAASAANVTLAIENVSWCALATVRDVSAFAARLEELAPATAIGFAFDPFQAAEAGANPFMILAAMGDRVVDVHLSDLRQGDPTARHLPPGEGDLPWSALLRAIAASYTGPLILEGIVGGDTTRLDRARGVLEPLLTAIAGANPDDPCSGPPPTGLLDGIALFNARQFYACHEVIEHEWHAERRPIRRLYQGILQIGVGFHHALGGNHRGALLLLTDGIEKTARFVPTCLGIETGTLVAESQACLDRLRALGPDQLAAFDPAMIPTIHHSPGTAASLDGVASSP